jgi:hypothetical protein
LEAATFKMFSLAPCPVTRKHQTQTRNLQIVKSLIKNKIQNNLEKLENGNVILYESDVERVSE